MLKLGLFIALLVALASAAPKPCCGPTQYVAGVGASVGFTSVYDFGRQGGFYAVLYGAFDFKARKFGFNVTVTFPNGTSQHIRVIQDYVQGSEWAISDDVKDCVKLPAQQPEPSNCVPANATHHGQIYMGGNTKLWTDSWADKNHTFPEYPLAGAFTSQTEIGNCNPVAFSFMGGNEDVQTVIAGSVYNLTLGIVDPDRDRWLTVPSFCNTNTTSNKIQETRPFPELDFFTLPRFF